MATLIDNPEFTPNEIYEIQANDPVEGAAEGASDGGIGLANQQAQQLANRTAKAMQLIAVDEANIATLQALVAQLVSSLTSNGYVKIPFYDINLGLIQAIVQWGKYGGTVSGDTQFNIAWPLAFSNACLWAIGVPTYASGQTPDIGLGIVTIGGKPQLFTDHGVFFANLFNANGEIGAMWLAIGY